MALSHLEPRLALIGNSFVEVDASPQRSSKRSRSYSGYIPYDLQETHPEPRQMLLPAAATAKLDAKPCALAPAPPDCQLGEQSTDVSGSQVSEPPSSPRSSEQGQCASESESEKERQASEPPSSARHSERGSCASESEPEKEQQAPQELWPDTDSDTEEYDWTPCSRRRLSTPARAQTECACPKSPEVDASALGASPSTVQPAPLPQILATQPASSLGVLPAGGSPFFPVPPPAQLAPPPAEAAPFMLGAALMPPQCPPSMPPAPLAPAPFPGQLEPPTMVAGAPPAQALMPAASRLLLPWPAPAMCVPKAVASPRSSAERSRAALMAAEAALAALEAAEEEEEEAAKAASAEASLAAASAAAAAAMEELTAGPYGPRRSSAQQPCADEDVTSLMLRNIPLHVSQREVLDEIHASGFDGKCDFLYMPRDFTSAQNRGHAFVNFTSPKAADEFRSAWHRQRRFDMGPNQPGINISVATLQGFARNVEKWDNPRMRRVRNPDFKPFVLDH